MFLTGPTLPFPFERLLDDRGFAFLDLNDPTLDCIFNLWNDKVKIALPEGSCEKYITMKCLT